MTRWPEEDRRREDKVRNLNKNLDLPEGFDFGGTTQTLFDSEGQMEVIFHQEHSLHNTFHRTCVTSPVKCFVKPILCSHFKSQLLRCQGGRMRTWLSLST